MITGKKRKFIPMEEGISKVDSQISSEKSQVSESEPHAPPASTEQTSFILLHEDFPGKKKFGFNTNVLYDYVRNPIHHRDDILFQDEHCLIIKDKYPKSTIHLLLLPRESFFHKLSMQEFVPEDLQKLRVLHDTAKNFTGELLRLLREKPKREESSSSSVPSNASSLTTQSGINFVDELKQRLKFQEIGEFKFGFHVLPSLFPLHLHLITNDYVSPFLKNKKHWNSFTSEFFFDICRVEALLERGETMKKILDLPHYEEVLKKSLSCHLCKQSMASLPALKNHLLFHFKKKDESAQNDGSG